MHAETMDICGAYLIHSTDVVDDRGQLTRMFCRQEFSEMGLATDFVQCSLLTTRSAHTLRGLHYQSPPYAEVKLVRCVQGSIFDVIADVRPTSPSFEHCACAVLAAGDQRSVYIPEGVAHGVMSLEDNTQLLYQMSACYNAAAVGGIRWDDPDLAIPWPAKPAVISERDKALPLLNTLVAAQRYSLDVELSQKG